jgi:hypothetical protein
MDNKMKTLGMLLASAVVCSTAHATVYQYAYTATIQEMLEFSAVTGSGGMVGASSLAGGTLAVGDLVQGYFSYDTDTGLFGNFGAGPVYAASTATNSLSAASASHNFALSAPASQSAMVQVSNNLALLGGGDNLAIGSVSENAAAEQLLAINFFDPSGQALSGDHIPGAINASAFGQSNFSYLYIDKDSRTLLGANGALTSLELISSVPEAQTYAMLLSGLGILAFLARRRKQSSH